MLAHRKESVAAQILKELSVMVKNELPEELGLVSLTDIEITSDFKEAKVFVSVFDVSKKDEVLNILEAKTPEFQKILGKKLTLKFTPKILFVFDNYEKKLERVDELLDKIKDGS